MDSIELLLFCIITKENTLAVKNTQKEHLGGKISGVGGSNSKTGGAFQHESSSPPVPSTTQTAYDNSGKDYLYNFESLDQLCFLGVQL